MNIKYWNDDTVEMLLDLVKKSPPLWNKKTSKTEKDLLWNKVAEELNIPLRVVQKKFLELVYTYRMALQKKNSNQSYEATWKYFHQLSFLEITSRKIDDNDFSLNIPDDEESADATEPSDATIESETDTSKLTKQRNTESTQSEYQPIRRVKFKASFVKHWNCENTIKFIDLVHARHVIWDDSNPTYVETTAQKNAWEEIAEEMNLSVEVLKNKFKSLCSTYYSIRKEIAKDALYIIGWIYFSHMEFLPMPASVLKTIAVIKAKHSATTSSSNSELQQNNSIATAPGVNTLQKENSDFAGSIIDITELVDDEEAAANNRKEVNASKNRVDKHVEKVQEMQISSTSKNNDITNLEDDAVKISDFAIFRNANKPTSEERTSKNQNLKRTVNKLADEYDIFGDVVANEMRAMCDFRLIQKVFKQKVKQALSEARAAAQAYDN